MEAGKINCSHTTFQHLFHNICCNSQTTLKKIVNVALNIITLCIPLIVYNIGYYAVALGAYIKEKKIQKAEEKQKELKNIEEKIQNFIDEIKDEKIDKEALIFAKQKLSEKPSLDVLQRITKRKEISYEIGVLETFFGKENEEIVYLVKLYYDYETKLKETIKAKKNNWDDEVNELAYSCLKIAYTVAVFILDDNKCFQKYKEEYLEKSLVPRLGESVLKGYLYKFETIFDCVRFSYNYIRKKILYNKKVEGKYSVSIEIHKDKVYYVEHGAEYAKKNIKNSLNSEDPYSKKFFKKGTIQNKCRELHNNYCTLIMKKIANEMDDSNRQNYKTPDQFLQSCHGRIYTKTRSDLKRNPKGFH